MEFRKDYRILIYGPDTINREAKPIWEEDYQDLPKLREYMIEVMKKANGIGLVSRSTDRGLQAVHNCRETKRGDSGLRQPRSDEALRQGVRTGRGMPEYATGRERVLSSEASIRGHHSRDYGEPGEGNEVQFGDDDGESCTARDRSFIRHFFFIDRVPEKRRRLVLERFHFWKSTQNGNIKEEENV